MNDFSMINGRSILRIYYVHVIDNPHRNRLKDAFRANALHILYTETLYTHCIYIVYTTVQTV